MRVTHSLAAPTLANDVRDAFMAPYQTIARRAGVGNFVADIPATPAHPSWAALDAVSTDISTLDVPALMLWGPKDPVFSDRYLRDLLTRLPQAQVHRFEGASHLVQEDRDIATPAFAWLADNVAGSDAGATADPAAGTPGAVGGAASTGAGAYVSMLAEVDARRSDTTTAVVDMLPGGGTRALTWAQLSRDVDDLAAGLRELGVKAGDRVNLLVPPGINLTTLIYACLRLGAVIVVADAGLGTKGLSRAIKGAGPDFLIGIERALAGARLYNWPGIRIAAEDFTGSTAAVKKALFNVAATVPQLMANGRVTRLAGYPTAFTAPEPDADAAVLFTSGSTGPAKGVVYTQRRLAAMRDTLKESYNLAAGTALVAGFAPFALLGPALGATTVTPDMDVTSPRTLTAKALAEAAAAINATVVFASPRHSSTWWLPRGRTFARAEKGDGRRRTSPLCWRPFGAHAAHQRPGVGCQRRPAHPYGMTEALPITDIDLPGILAAGVGNGVCVGSAVAGATVSIAPITAAGLVLESTTAANVTGEILVSAPHVKDRYDRLWITEQHSVSIPGWHRTGDVGHLDTEGRLWVEGRMEHILTTPAGVKTPVAPEQAIETVAGVARAAVVGVGPMGTQAAVAIIETTPAVKRPGLAPAPLAAAVRAASLSVGLPLAAVLTIDAMPTDVRHNSKIDRAKLSRWAARMLAGEKAGQP
ncbi:AMP-binding protein [Arthrobacter alpinus]|nr:AMP-binding protein [Arthrobacter alpinus]